VEERRSLEREGLATLFRVHPVIPYLDSLALMRRSDLLLTVDARLTQSAESVFLPSKLVDYLGSGTPVLAVTPRRGATARVVAESGGIVCDIEDDEAIEGALERIVDQGPPPPPAPAALAPYEHLEVARQLLDVAAGLRR
ncbi:MAG: hypothetical protein FJY75_08760, partial [Candidatus Eisenbacteria bacterium]|nr:hypothetical protein [Candidatus Eisenbacteria bacterium]